VQHGDAELPELGRILLGDCPKAEAASFGERCSLHFPQLLRLWKPQGSRWTSFDAGPIGPPHLDQRRGH